MTSMVEMNIYEAIGVAAFALYVMNYLLLTIEEVSSEQASYFVLNWLAATFVSIGLMQSFNLASALIQIFWIGISSWGIYVRFSRQGRSADSPLGLSA
ncbi:CBU_0592 family membrane protein [Cognatiyoonia sp.]|uniref:CBU_0592 family membrane protein n=1 Tax=Cognatiyoonia sp. TaxID=2211652 RepID=UPI003F6A3B4F